MGRAFLIPQELGGVLCWHFMLATMTILPLSYSFGAACYMQWTYLGQHDFVSASGGILREWIVESCHPPSPGNLSSSLQDVKAVNSPDQAYQEDYCQCFLLVGGSEWVNCATS